MAQRVGECRVRTEPFLLELARDFVEPLTERNAFRASRLAVLHDGTTKPVLDILAAKRYPEGWDEDQFPFWVDGNRRNEMLENVGLATRSSTGNAARRSSYGVPAGTKEYMRLWRAKNREKLRASQKRYADRQRNVLDAAIAAAEDDPILAKLLRATQKSEGGENE